jgi:hypothetical protein
MNQEEVVVAIIVAERIRSEADDDYVGLWKLTWHLRRELPDASDGLVFELAEAILGGLLKLGVVLGDLDGTSGMFVPWSPTGALDTAMAAWRSLGRDPNIGEVAWLARSW